MNRKDLLLAILASAEGRPYSPVQLQKALFLVSRRMPEIVNDGPHYQFVPYDYGPFDSAVYGDATALANTGEAVIAPSPWGRWNTYAVSDAGLTRGRQILAGLDIRARTYLMEVSAWVRAQSFSSLVKSIYDAYPDMRTNSIFRG